MSDSVQARCPQCGATYALSGDLLEHHRTTPGRGQSPLPLPFVCRACRFPFDPFLGVPAQAAGEPVATLEYFDGGEQEEPGKSPIRNATALRSMICGMAACAMAMVAALLELPPWARPAACAGIAIVGVIAAGLGASAMRTTEDSFVDRALTINGIGLGAMAVVAAVILV